MNAPNSEQAKGIATIMFAVVVLVLIVVLFKKFTGFFGGITDGIGITDSKDEKTRKGSLTKLLKNLRESGAEKNPFSRQYYRQVNTKASTAKTGERILDTSAKTGGNLTEATARKLAKEIYGAVGLIKDDPGAISGAIKGLPTKAQVSYLADIFYTVYGNDLLDFLENKLDTTSQQLTLEGIIQAVNKMPSGFTVKK